MISQSDKAALFEKLLDKEWRMSHLYSIVDKSGQSIAFKPNWAQKQILKDMHKRELILKARQLGISTFTVLYLLDECLFNRDYSAGIVSYSLDHARYIFNKIINHALKNLPPFLQSFAETEHDSQREKQFKNGSSIRVDTTLRGGSYQGILITEFGKTCARAPLKSEEIVTGTLQAVSKDCLAIIESTAEGAEGYFYDFCMTALHNDNKTPLDWHIKFFPWHKEPTYFLDYRMNISQEDEDYFNELKNKHGISLTIQQKYWYVNQKIILGDKIKQEFPSTVDESFLASTDAYYFASEIHEADRTGRILQIQVYDPLLPTYVAIDLGLNHATAIVFYQVQHGEIRIIDYYEDYNKGADFIARFLLKDKPYHYAKIFLPHDSRKRSPTDERDTVQLLFQRLFAETKTVIQVLPRQDKQLSIANARSKIKRCVFVRPTTEKLIQHMQKYRKKFSQATGQYLPEPLDDEHADASDAFQYAMQSIDNLEAQSMVKDALQKHRELKNYRKVY